MASQLNWLATVDFIAHNFVLLEFALNIEDVRSASRGYLNDQGQEDSEKKNADWGFYRRLAAPLVQLCVLRNFYLRFRRPHHEKDTPIRNQMAVLLEKQVMGEAYGSTANGKYLERDRLRAAAEREMKPIFGPDEMQIWPLIYS